MPQPRYRSRPWPSLVLVAAALVAAWPGLARGGAADYPYLSWQDEFDGSAVESARWSFDIGTGSQYGLTGWGNNELQYYTDRSQNASVSGGVLRITARSESFGGQAYTSARLKTQGKFSQAGGRFEIRAALPTGQGFWPAIWMLPETNGYGGWAASGEIDIMEARGQQPDRVHGTIHYGGAWPNNTWSESTRMLPAGQSIASFHTYALEWDTSGSPAIRWYVDDVLYATKTSWWSAGGSYPAPFDKPFSLLLNVAVGGNYVGNPNGSTIFPGTMQVDYVRVSTAAPPAITLAAPSGTLSQAAVGNPLITAASSVTKTGAGTMRLTSANTYTGPTRVQAGRLDLAHPSAAATSIVQVSGSATLLVADLLDSRVGGLRIDSGGRVDVGSGRLTVASGWSAATAYATAAAARGDGSWTRQAGIGSSTVAAAVAAGSPRAVGWLDNGDGSITFAATAVGDATLDGFVDILDAAAITSSAVFDSPAFATWQQGDFNYDRVVDILDVADFVSTGLFDAGAIPLAGLAVAAVPEPAIGRPVAGAAIAALLLHMVRRSGWARSAARTTGRSPESRTR
jgi:autotransporter-associated beta strand protein